MRTNEAAELGELNPHAKGRYAPKGWDFPRLGLEITPDEILTDRNRVLGRGIQARMEYTGRTVLRQPRVETTAVRMISGSEGEECRMGNLELGQGETKSMFAVAFERGTIGASVPVMGVTLHIRSLGFKQQASPQERGLTVTNLPVPPGTKLLLEAQAPDGQVMTGAVVTKSQTGERTMELPVLMFQKQTSWAPVVAGLAGLGLLGYLVYNASKSKSDGSGLGDNGDEDEDEEQEGEDLEEEEGEEGEPGEEEEEEEDEEEDEDEGK